MFLVYCPLFIIFYCTIANAQDIPNTVEPGSDRAAAQRKKAVAAAKPKVVKPKETVAFVKTAPPRAEVKTSAAQFKNKPKNTAKIDSKPDETIRGDETISGNYTAIPVSGTVKLKQLNQAAAGILIEAIRVDTREMIDSAETNVAGEFKFKKLPANVDLVFLVSSANTKPLIFKTAIGNGMKNLDFTVFPK